MANLTFRLRRCRNCNLIQLLPQASASSELLHCTGCRRVFYDSAVDFEELGTTILTVL